jgi:sulfur-oxidizing protein SoxY
MTERTTRRHFLAVMGGLAVAGVAPRAAAQPAAPPATTAAEALANMREAIAQVVKGRPVKPGKVVLDLPPLVENGNTVPLGVTVDSPMTPADHVKAIHVFTEKNPQPNVAAFHLGPHSGRASVATRVRLANTQNVLAICEMSDGTLWSGTVEVVVTLGACLEDSVLI